MQSKKSGEMQKYKHRFKVGDNVIGKQYPDDIYAIVIELIESEGIHRYVIIEYDENEKKKTATIPEYRLINYERKNITAS